MAYFFYRIVFMVERRDPVFSMATSRLEPGDDVPWTPAAFSFGFGLRKALDPRIGYFTVELTKSKANLDGTRTKPLVRNLTFSSCLS